MANQWKPIDTAPKDGTVVLGCAAGYDERTDLGAHPRAIRYESFHPNAPGKRCWRNMSGHKELYLTHWMPLPAAPE